jgi:hypothetical protein
MAKMYAEAQANMTRTTDAMQAELDVMTSNYESATINYEAVLRRVEQLEEKQMGLLYDQHEHENSGNRRDGSSSAAIGVGVGVTVVVCTAIATAVIALKRERANKRADVARRQSVSKWEQPAHGDGVDHDAGGPLQANITHDSARDNGDGERHLTQRSVYDMDVGASNKSGNNNNTVGSVELDSVGGSTDTAVEYVVPYESASGDTGNSFYQEVSDDDCDTGGGMAYSTTLGAITYAGVEA